ncbi:MAG: dTDP-glucose 4,6-dehydratase, partial [Elusimicrobia bacterium]
MKLLVTGGAGFIGSHCIRHILRKYPGYSVVNLDKLTYAGNLENLRDVEGDPRNRFVRGDICDGAVVREAMRGMDAVLNFAAESHVDRSILGADEFLKTDVLGTFTLLEAARE